jgi:hypothetical protein
MAVSYKGISGYAPLIITLANTREVLYLVNRPGNAVSHEGFVPWIDRAIELQRPRAGESEYSAMTAEHCLSRDSLTRALKTLFSGCA